LLARALGDVPFCLYLDTWLFDLPWVSELSHRGNSAPLILAQLNYPTGPLFLRRPNRPTGLAVLPWSVGQDVHGFESRHDRQGCTRIEPVRPLYGFSRDRTRDDPHKTVGRNRCTKNPNSATGLQLKNLIAPQGQKLAQNRIPPRGGEFGNPRY